MLRAGLSFGLGMTVGIGSFIWLDSVSRTMSEMFFIPKDGSIASPGYIAIPSDDMSCSIDENATYAHAVLLRRGKYWMRVERHLRDVPGTDVNALFLDERKKILSTKGFVALKVIQFGDLIDEYAKEHLPR